MRFLSFVSKTIVLLNASVRPLRPAKDQRVALGRLKGQRMTRILISQRTAGYSGTKTSITVHECRRFSEGPDFKHSEPQVAQLAFCRKTNPEIEKAKAEVLPGIAGPLNTSFHLYEMELYLYKHGLYS